MARKTDDLAASLRLALGLLYRRLRQEQVEGELTFPESAALARLDRGGPASPSVLAKLEQISQQSMGATLAALERRELVERTPDALDRRSVVMSLTPAGRKALRDRRAARNAQLAEALAGGFTDEELETLRAAVPLIERLAQTI